jgi:GTP cyclohydrolase I
VTDLNLPDVQNEMPDHNIRLDSVGVRGLQVPVLLDIGTVVASLDLAVNLPAAQRGVHMSRFHRTLDTMPAGLRLAEFPAVLAAMLLDRHPYADRAEVLVTVNTVVAGTVTPTTIRAVRGADVPRYQTMRDSCLLTVRGATVCPCALAMSGGRQSHVQRAEIAAEIFDPVLPLSELREMLCCGFSAPAASVLDRPSEKSHVARMFAHPRFVEDVAREAVAALRAGGAGSGARVTVVSFESIHPYDCFAAWEGSLARDAG